MFQIALERISIFKKGSTKHFRGSKTVFVHPDFDLYNATIL